MRISLVMVVVGAILILLGLVMALYDEEYTIKEVPCYDEYNNKMIDIMCEEKVYEYSGSWGIKESLWDIGPIVFISIGGLLFFLAWFFWGES